VGIIRAVAPQIEQMAEGEIIGIAQSLPPQWYDGQTQELDRLVRTLVSRRKQMRSLIEDLRRHAGDVFPSWKDAAQRNTQA